MAMLVTAFACTPPKTAVVESVSVTGVKTEFEWGEQFSFGSGVVTAKFDDGTEKEIASGYTVDSSAYQAQTSGQYTIVVSYQGKQAIYTVTVKQSTVSSITVSGAKEEFTYGDAFTSEGIVVTANYTDGSNQAVASGYTVDSSAYKAEVPGQYTIVVSYLGKQATYTVTVKESTVSSVSVSGAKTEFEWNEPFSFSGEVTITYKDNTSAVVTSGYTVNSGAYSTGLAGVYTIVVSYQGQQTSYEVTIKEPPITEIRLSKLKLEYEWGEDFVFEGVVKEKYANGAVNTIDQDRYVVNSDAYNSEVAGVYTIIVSHRSDVTVQKSFEVTVKPAKVVEVKINSFKQTFSVFENYGIADIEGVLKRADGTESPISADNAILDKGDEFKELTLGAFNFTVKSIENEQATATISVTVTKAQKVRILFIGNSFSDDTSEHMPNILKSLGYTDFEVCNLYIGGCTIDTHYYNVQTNAATYEMRYYKSGSYSWTQQYGNKMQSLDYAIKFSDWDIISIQQASGSSGMPNTYFNLDSLAKMVKEKTTNENVRLVFNMTWAYQQNSTHSEFNKYAGSQITMYNAIVSTVKSQVDFTVIPNGTAIQNARTSFVGDTLTRDGYHLSTDLGRYIAGLTFLGKVLGEDLSKVTFAPAGLSAEYCAVAVESATNAIAKPFEITPSEFKSIEETFLTGVVEMEYEKYGWTTAGGYWDSTDPSKYNSRFEATSGFVAQFVTTKRFTKAELPVGSVIKIESGWQYRPEAWTSDTVQPSATRPVNVTTTYIKVTEQWWGNYIYRAFNVSKAGGLIDFGQDPANPQFEMAKSKFTIYVPKTA